jgi:hypothetical protein
MGWVRGVAAFVRGKLTPPSETGDRRAVPETIIQTFLSKFGERQDE